MADENYWDRWTKRQRTALKGLPGGSVIIDHFGFVPSFHDAEIMRLDLRRGARSTIELMYWKTAPQTDPCVVEMVMGTVIDVVLDGFSSQNAVGDIGFYVPGPFRPERERMYFPTTRLDEEVEILISPTYGLSGFIRCLDLSFAIRPFDSLSR